MSARDDKAHADDHELDLCVECGVWPVPHAGERCMTCSGAIR